MIRIVPVLSVIAIGALCMQANGQDGIPAGTAHHRTSHRNLFAQHRLFPRLFHAPVAHQHQRPAVKYDDAAARYPKWYGGFHSSHFSNIGVPPGDIGFRGNGIYWTPW